MTSTGRDRGAIAPMAAVLLAFALFTFGALAVDLGNAWARKRAVQNTADLAALAGAGQLPDTGAARAAAADYVTRNPVAGMAPAAGWDTDGDLANGEIRFYVDSDADGTLDLTQDPVAPSGGGADFIRVVAPPAHVDFGLAGVVGASGVDVQRPATARVASAIGLGVPPFFLFVGDTGEVCVKDDSNGGGPPTPTGTPPPPSDGVTLTSITANPAAAGDTVTLTGGGLPDNGQPKVHFGTTEVPPVTVSATSYTVVVPAGTGAVDVWVTKGAVVSSSVVFTYAGPPPPPPLSADPCQGTSSNRGYIDEPRFDFPPSQTKEKNIKSGIDHSLLNYTLWPEPAPRPMPGPDTNCDAQPADLIYKSGATTPLPRVNCARLSTGGIGGQLKPGFFDTSATSPGRMLQDCPGPAADITLNGIPGVDGNTLFDEYFVDTSKGSLDELKTALGSGVPLAGKEGWIKDTVFECPRFAYLPVVNLQTEAPNGTSYFPIVGFSAVWIDDVWIDDPTAERGFKWEGSSLSAVRGIVIPLAYLPAEAASAAAGGIGTYNPELTKVTQLVRDPGDRDA